MGRILIFGPLVVLAGIALVAGLAASNAPRDVERVWSEEHGHFHTLKEGLLEDGEEVFSAEPPPGSPPPGKIWSDAHGHWHDVQPSKDQPLPSSSEYP